MDALLTSQDAATVIVGLMVLLGTMIGLGTPIWLSLRRGREAADEARSNAADARLAATAVQTQMAPNGGSTLRDAIDRLERGQRDIGKLADRMAATADRIDSRTLILDQRLSAVDQRLSAVERHVTP